MNRNIKFETDQYPTKIPATGSPLVNFLIKNKIVTHAAQANLFLLVVAIFFLLISVFIFTSQQTQPDPSLEPDPDTLIGNG